MELRPEEITKIIRSQIKNYENKMEVSETGVVILVGDGIAKASGLDKCMAGELVEFPDGSFGMAQNLEEDTVSIVILGSDQGRPFRFRSDRRSDRWRDPRRGVRSPGADGGRG